jgi:Protein of unknown function (DUF2723)
VGRRSRTRDRPTAVIRRWLVDRGGALALAVLVYYLVGAPPFIVENDNAEFATLGAVGGVAHPSGYPLYILWLRAWSWLPGSSPAHTAALATAILGALQIFVLHAACRAWGARALAATLAVGIYAVAPLVARYNTSAEAFAMNGLAAGLVLWLAAQHGPLRGWKRAGLLGLVAGLGLANHLTCALVAPVGVLGVVRGAREGFAVRAIAASVVGLALGLSAYGYLLIAPDHAGSWWHPEGLGDLVAYFTRQEYGGALGFSGQDAHRPWLENLAELARTVGRSWLYVGALGALGMLGYRIARPSHETRAGFIALAATLLLAGPILVMRFDMPIYPTGFWIARRFHLLPILLLVIPAALAFDWVDARYPLKERLRYAIVAVVIVAAAITSAPYLARHRTPAMDYEVRNTLTSLPQNAVVIGAVDELDVGTHYLQIACNVRPDITYIRWSTSNWKWYAARLAPFHNDVTKPYPRRQFAEQAFALGRPVFIKLEAENPDLEGLAHYPYGIVDRLLPPGEPMPSLDAVVAMNQALFAKFRLDYAKPTHDDDWATWMHYNYVQVWTRLAGALVRANKPEAAAAARDVATQLAPR